MSSASQSARSSQRHGRKSASEQARRHGASGSTTHARRPATTDELLDRLYEKVGHESNLSLTDHVSAGRLLCRLRDHLIRGERPSSKGAIKLLASGTALHRRFAVGDCGGGADADIGRTGPTDDQLQQQQLDDSRELVRGTAARLFALLCTLEMERRLAQVERGLQSLDVDAESRQAVARVGMSSLWEVVRDPPKRRKKQKKTADGDDEQGNYDTESAADGDADGEADAEDDGEVSDASRWHSVVRATSADVARHALRIGASCLDDESWKALDSIMPLFFRHSAFNMAESLLMPDGDKDYLSLGTAAAMAELTPAQREKKLLAIAQAGESEAGQQVTRDLVLSFLLPSSHVGVRRTLLLTRAASTQAGVDHPTIVSRAHDTAMAGTEWIWTNGTDQLERMCCLLAGIAVLTTKGDEDPIRKADAYGGRMQLPFYETQAPAASALRIALVPSARRWILFRLDKRGMPKVAASLRGFEGLCTVALQLVASLR